MTGRLAQIHLRWLGLLFCLALCVPPATAGTIHDDFLDLLSATPRSEHLAGIIMLEEQIEVPALERAIRAQGLSTRAARHEFVVRSAQDHAARTQAPLLARLERLRLEGIVRSYQSFWVTNMVFVEAYPETFYSIAARSDVGTIYANKEIPLRFGWDEEADPPDQLRTSLPNSLVCVNVEPAWNLGFRGQGRIVCTFDSGADGAHPAYASRWRGLQPGVNWWEAWKDPYTNSTFPYDARNHGTHVLGIITAQRPDGLAIGVAPGALWIAAGATIFYDVAKIIQCYQWAADPDGNPATIQDVPDVINNSWGTSDDCATTFWNAIDLVEAAGIVNTIAVDNTGPGAGTVNSPESRASSPTVNWGIGNVNPHEPSYPIHTLSGRGPSPCDGVSIKPEVTAPGVQIYSTLPGNQYGLKTGTSMACPHTSGAVAILRQVDPDITVDDIKWILMRTAVDKGTAGEDNTYGWGIINIGAAVDSVRRRLPRIPPQNLTAALVAERTVRLTWERPAPIHPNNPLIDYRVYRAIDGQPFPPLPQAVLTNPAQLVTYEDNGVPFGSLRYTVRARYQVALSDTSNHALIPAETWLQPPRNLAVTQIVGDSVSLQWERPSPVHPANPLLSYRIFRALNADSLPDQPVAVHAASGSLVTFTDTAAPYGNLTYAVTAWYAAAESDTSNHAGIPVGTWAPAPSSLALAVDADTVRISWERPSPVHPENPLIVYRLFRAPSGDVFGEEPLAEIQDDATVVAAVDSGVPFASFQYAVMAAYELAESPLSPSVLLDRDRWMSAPMNLTASAEMDSVHLTWARPDPIHPANPIQHYRLYRALEQDTFPALPLAEVVSSDSVVAYDDLEVPAGSYKYRATAYYEAGEGAASNEATAATVNPAAIEEIAGRPAAELRVAPNPLAPHTFVRFRVARPDPVRLEVFSVTGARVRTLYAGAAPAGEVVLPWDGRDSRGRPVASGTYFVRLQQGAIHLDRRIVLLR